MNIQTSKFSKIFLRFFLVGTYLYLFIFYLLHQPTRTTLIPTGEAVKPIVSTEKVVRIIDGDTFEINGGIKVRLIGVDTPEMKNKNKTVDCFAREASQKLGSLISGHEVRLEKDISETDKYGRLLRYVYLGDEMINDTLVKEGYAKIATFPPDVKNAGLFLSSEKFARESKLGLWSACR
ncbi:hypothetical protein A3K29_03080 [Candidatus Collierbacteria bacterium RIFOXYB2_FULL_46_14]|uniref:WD40 domain protein beta Propeller n=1 Tax=Candidatus Collierbacteria bacterium GW2011_GWA2_46_26 TaxID=1618381 RepID=A0A0G1PMC1_9BACT|nr:MAG: WD40 domain protein beta Propeller [Candidatus Collierbacteria bacterium GW2011_GWC2_44_13]KKU33827.1 MAG: WD40 domain protein beta Propeller [Candidatus Collierbacteria bacterium GW2011_GWA2_46_26]OGD73104.1 MAG: hypothetical protein A3K29_03080 [Candidatus Collierbacteria bacterium RIFOXYB2_FULL_46_14]OGD76146.1 MAG: hypothetical protein A3K43_03080 [Candidatus Collierbacteria bacterium RIFOXYA2_FULL_46_20]OGD77482.1 MAG: hypothetical protein A3K39_03080 [Candidatus Collierbacteria ba